MAAHGLHALVSAVPLQHSEWPHDEEAVQAPLEQVCPAAQVPQERVPPQPSEIVPQDFPWAAQVVGVQVVLQSPHIDFASPTQVESQAVLQQ